MTSIDREDMVVIGMSIDALLTCVRNDRTVVADPWRHQGAPTYAATLQRHPGNSPQVLRRHYGGR